jgi:hypothetical protein
MTDTQRIADGDAEQRGVQGTERMPEPAAFPPAWSLVLRGLWVGALVGGVSGPVVALIVFTVPALGGTATSGGSLGFAFVLVLLSSAYLALFGALVGLIAGVLAALGVYCALRLAAHRQWGLPAVLVRVLGGVVGGAVAGVLANWMVAGLFPWGSSYSVVLVVATLVVAALVTAGQGAPIERMRRENWAAQPIETGHVEAGIDNMLRVPVRMPRTRVFRIWGTVLAALVALALGYLALVISLGMPGFGCYGGMFNTSFLSREVTTLVPTPGHLRVCRRQCGACATAGSRGDGCARSARV